MGNRTYRLHTLIGPCDRETKHGAAIHSGCTLYHLWRAHLSRGPFKDETSGETAAKSVEEPERVTFRRHERGVDVQAVTHGIVAPCMNMVGEDTVTAPQRSSLPTTKTENDPRSAFRLDIRHTIQRTPLL